MVPYTASTNLPYGGQVITCGGVTYVVEGDFSLNHPTREIQRRDQNGDESDFMIRAEPSKNTAKWQLATSVTTLPALGTTFTAAGGTGSTQTVLCVVTEVKPTYPQGGIWYVDVGWRAITLLTT